MISTIPLELVYATRTRRVRSPRGWPTNSPNSVTGRASAFDWCRTVGLVSVYRFRLPFAGQVLGASWERLGASWAACVVLVVLFMDF